MKMRIPAEKCRPAVRRARLRHIAIERANLRIPPGKLEALKAARKGQHGIHADDRSRTCSVFGIEPRFGLNLQSEYDIRVGDRELRTKLAPRIRVFQPAGA